MSLVRQLEVRLVANALRLLQLRHAPKRIGETNLDVERGDHRPPIQDMEDAQLGPEGFDHRERFFADIAVSTEYEIAQRVRLPSGPLPAETP